MIKYRVDSYFGNINIVRLDVKMAAKTYTITGQVVEKVCGSLVDTQIGRHKIDPNEPLFDTIEECKAWAVAKAERRVALAEKHLADTRRRAENLRKEVSEIND